MRFTAAPPLSASRKLNDAAAGHARDMARRKFFDHRGDDGSQPKDRVIRAGYQPRLTGENIAFGPESAEEVVAGWLASPGHCANIMDSRFQHIGVGLATGRGARPDLLGADFRRAALTLLAYPRVHGISAARRIRVQGAGAQPRHRHVRRRQRVLQGLGRHRRRGGDAPGRHLPRRRADACSTRPTCIRAAWPRKSSAQAIKGRRDQVLISTKGTFRDRRRAQRRRLVALPSDSSRRRQPAAARHRLHRPVSSCTASTR